jgi:hypothetical protein
LTGRCTNQLNYHPKELRYTISFFYHLIQNIFSSHFLVVTEKGVISDILISARICT